MAFSYQYSLWNTVFLRIFFCALKTSTGYRILKIKNNGLAVGQPCTSDLLLNLSCICLFFYFNSVTAVLFSTLRILTRLLEKITYCQLQWWDLQKVNFWLNLALVRHCWKRSYVTSLPSMVVPIRSPFIAVFMLFGGLLILLLSVFSLLVIW